MLITELTLPDTYIDVKQKVERMCSEALQAMMQTKCLLYRTVDDGNVTRPFHENGKLWAILSSPVNREPKGMHPRVHEFLDNCLRQSGATALRSNSSCCATTLSHAKTFNWDNDCITFAVFPIDGFSFAYSPNVHDFGGSEFLGPAPDQGRALIRRVITNPILQTWINEFNDWAKFDHTNFSAALQSGNEVWIHGSYVITPVKIGRQIIGLQ